MQLQTLFTPYTLFALLTLSANTANAQGCSDAGFCTVGHMITEQPGLVKQPKHKHEIDIVYIYGTHGKYERFYQPQINYRLINKRGNYFEARLPLNIAKNISSGLSTTGIGDAIMTYNSRFALSKRKIDYSLGLRISFTSSDKKVMNSVLSYPMYLQSGLGTTDLVAVAGYNIGKYISIGTGVQIPFLQYNDHIPLIADSTTLFFTPKGFRRQPDALLKLTGHYAAGQFKVSAGVLGIFHLANDYYKISKPGKYVLKNSQGTTINWNAELSYTAGKKLILGFLFAEPIVTRKNIPDGLARSRIYSPKATFIF